MKESDIHRMLAGCGTPLELWAISEFRKDLDIVYRILKRPVRGMKDANKNAWVVLLYAHTILNRRLGTMATKQKQDREFKFEGWVNIRLEDEHKAELEHLAQEIDIHKVLDFIASMVYGGYSFSLAWDDWSDSQQVTFVCKDPDDPNFGYGMSARHPDLDLALLTLQYKHSHIAGGNWHDVAPSPRNGWS